MAAMRRRSSKHVPCTTRVMIQPWANEHAAEIPYSVNVAIRIMPTASKSMLPVPAILAVMPLNSSVVAVESTFGPMMLNTVEPKAKTTTTTRAAL